MKPKGFQQSSKLAAQILHIPIRNLEALKGLDGIDLWVADLEHTSSRQQRFQHGQHIPAQLTNTQQSELKFGNSNVFIYTEKNL